MSINYHYTATDEAGKTRRGQIMAESPEEVYRLLKQQGLFLIKAGTGFLQTGTNAKRGWNLFRPKRLHLRQICLQLGLMERAGIPLLTALLQLKASAPTAKLRHTCHGLYTLVSGGSRLSQAMENYPHIFDAVFCGAVRTGEQLGNTRNMFEDMAAHLLWLDELAKRLRRAMTYPIILSVGIVLVIGFLMAVLVPEVTKFLVFLRIDPPFFTRSLVWVSGMVENYWWLIVCAFVLFLLAFYGLRRFHQGFGKMLDKFLLKMPFFGKTMRYQAMAIFARQMALLSKKQRSVEDNVLVATAGVDNSYLRTQILAARGDIMQGMSLGQAMNRYNLFPFALQKILEVSENSENLGKAFEEIAVAYTHSIDQAVDTATNLLRPLLLLIAALLLVWVILGTFLPLYSVVSKG
jgi:type IV pilus assembly protein PilC